MLIVSWSFTWTRLLSSSPDHFNHYHGRRIIVIVIFVFNIMFMIIFIFIIFIIIIIIIIDRRQRSTLSVVVVSHFHHPHHNLSPSPFPLFILLLLLIIFVITYGKCSKISNTFLFLFSNKMLVLQGKNSQNACQNSKQGRPLSDCFFRSSLIWVCPICLPAFLAVIFGVQCLRSFTIFIILLRSTSNSVNQNKFKFC